MTFYFHVHRQGRTITKSFGRTRDRAPKQAAGVAYFNEQGELLLCKRRTGITDHPGEWAFPAGGVEPGESSAAAARREFKEELDHSLPSLASAPAVEHGRFTAYVYWGESFTPDLDHEHTEWGWFHTEYLPEPTHPGVVAVLEAMPTVVLAHLLSERAATQDADFKEDEHPRDGDGKFTAGAGGGSSSAKPTKATAKGSKAGVHELLSSGHPFTVEELMEATGSTNRVTITTALSDLKNPKYAGALGHLAITKRPDGMYHVEKATTSAAAEAKEAPTTKPTKNSPREVYRTRSYAEAKKMSAATQGLKTKAEQDEEAEKRYGGGTMAPPAAALEKLAKLNDSSKAHFKGELNSDEVFAQPMNVGMNFDLRDAAPDYDELGVEMEVDTSALIPTQTGVDVAQVAALLKGEHKASSLPTVIRSATTGALYLQDGHHRAAGERLKGTGSMKVLVVDYKRRGGEDHFLKPTPTRARTQEPVAPPAPKVPSELSAVGITSAEHDAFKKYKAARAGTPEHEQARIDLHEELGGESDDPDYRLKMYTLNKHHKEPAAAPKAPEWKKDSWQSFHRATLASGHTASKAEHPNGDVTYTVRGGGSTFVHNIKTDSEGTILHHRVEMPITIQTVKGPAPGTTQKGLNPNQAAKHAGVYKDLGLVPWHKQDPTP